MAKKKCFKCKKSKPLEEFYPHPQMADGRLGKCKECTKKDARAHAQTPKAIEYQKRREKDPARKVWKAQAQRKHRANNPGRARARNAVANALRDGRLIRLPCEECGNKRSQAHHRDYRSPLKVRWLCFKHHRENEHQQLTHSPAQDTTPVPGHLPTKN